ncbi:tRNA glutamyl-Q(34) synthetase GluQRS [Nesterenkonia sp. E16_7]|uniref:tRNA glutamyl-Q(34) synthetase GluQRS n=1 Tax=unclassified Nesterenkonia TaxID=2629769 RepID=UPI001A9283C9|nr:MULTISPECIES: tRNA glutamyl-Q(34) synthetase GluQRS [unclassified Nesterenkonia]MBO0594088.1 tRNA glutamyl-Q(34) synthetase GluQRS [Nesterenkonia sp. E16_10]MBO0597534.1 tRNA glutamyl-Q(34) synthetase GluQRS [Nesterenkonia sp. E16_7]
MPAGRYAPSPSGELHLGNLRTGMLAWLFARSTGRAFLLRFEDLDAARTVPGSAEQQLQDLQAMGLSFDAQDGAEMIWQSERTDRYAAAIAALEQAGLTYECFCSRREIREAARAPHGPTGAYPGTCRDLDAAERARRRAQRPAAVRLRTPRTETGAAQRFAVEDMLLGQLATEVDDFVIQRNDGAAAYNLAVVVDDQLTGVDQVVRGDDLASSTPSQAYLRGLLYGTEAAAKVQYAHVPLVLNTEGERLAKRDGAVTLAALKEQGIDAEALRDLLLVSLGLPAGPLDQALGSFDPQALPSEPWVFQPPGS